MRGPHLLHHNLSCTQPGWKEDAYTHTAQGCALVKSQTSSELCVLSSHEAGWSIELSWGPGRCRTAAARAAVCATPGRPTASARFSKGRPPRQWPCHVWLWLPLNLPHTPVDTVTCPSSFARRTRKWSSSWSTARVSVSRRCRRGRRPRPPGPGCRTPRWPPSAPPGGRAPGRTDALAEVPGHRWYTGGGQGGAVHGDQAQPPAEGAGPAVVGDRSGRRRKQSVQRPASEPAPRPAVSLPHTAR